MKSSNQNIQIKPSKKKGKSKVDIILQNELNIYSMHEIKEKIIEAYKKYSEISFEIKDVKNIDLTFAQFLFSIKATALKDKKTITVSANFEDDIESLLQNADIKKVIR